MAHVLLFSLRGISKKLDWRWNNLYSEQHHVNELYVLCHSDEPTSFSFADKETEAQLQLIGLPEAA